MKTIKNSALGLTGIIGVVALVFGIRVPFAESLAKEYWRYGLMAMLLIILVFPFALGLFVYLVDVNRFKAEIVQFVKVQTQRDLVLQGDIKLTIFPKLGLDSGKMSLSQRNSAKEFASINNARFYVAWLPLLKKQMVFDRVVIDGMKANVTRRKDGTTNFDDLLIHDENLAPMTFDIDGVGITNSSINLLDEMELQRVSLHDLQLETSRLADTVPSNLSVSFHLNSEKSGSDAQVELKSRLFFDRKAGRYEFADIEGKLEGKAAGIENLVLNFKGNLDTYPAMGSLTAEDIGATMTGIYGPGIVDTRLGVAKLQINKGIWNGNQLTIDLALTQPNKTLTTALQIPTFEIASKTFNAAEPAIDFDFKADGSSLQGKLTGPLSMNFETAPNIQLGNIILSFAARHPALSGELAATATGSAQADFAAQNASLDFNAKIDDSEIAGKATLRDFNRPAYTLELNANHLDMDRYLATDWLMRFQDDAMPFDLGVIKELNLNGSLRAGELKMAKLNASKLAANIRIEQSKLTIEPLSANFYGGTLTGSISAAAQGTPQLTLKQNLKGIQMSALLADTTAAGKLAGKGDLVTDLSAEGDTVGALRKSLNGFLSLALVRGTIAGVDLRSALLEGKDELGTPGSTRTRAMNFAEKTEFSELKAAFNFKEGNSTANSFEMKSPLLRTTGEGDIAMDTGNIDYRLKAAVAPALSRRTSGELAELKGVTVPIFASGPYAAPTLVLDFAAASGDIVARRIAARAAAEAKAAAEQAAAEKAAAEQVAADKAAADKAAADKAAAEKAAAEKAAAEKAAAEKAAAEKAAAEKAAAAAAKERSTPPKKRATKAIKK